MSRYLLETSATDGYLLEDGSGVLLIDAPVVVDGTGGQILFTGGTAGAVVARSVNATGAAVLFSGGSAGMVAVRSVAGTGAAITFSPGSASLVVGRVVDGAGASVLFAGGEADLEVAVLTQDQVVGGHWAQGGVRRRRRDDFEGLRAEIEALMSDAVVVEEGVPAYEAPSLEWVAKLDSMVSELVEIAANLGRAEKRIADALERRAEAQRRAAEAASVALAKARRKRKLAAAVAAFWS